MKVLHINYHSTRGGAARAMRRLHLGLRSHSIQSRLLVREGALSPELGSRFQVDIPEPERLWEQLAGHLLQHKGVDQHRTRISNTTFNLPLSGFDLSRHPEVIDADIINLHWPTYVLSARSLRLLLALGKPVFWTIHDQWAFTGGCHYSAGCSGYERNCAACPQLSGELSNLASAALREKRRQLSGHQLEVVAPSKWIADCARRSSLLRDHPIHWVPNGVEHEVFRPLSKVDAKRKLGLPDDRLVLLFGADHLIEIRKGWSLLRLALDSAIETLGGKAPFCLAFFGETSSELEKLPVPLFPLGYIDNDKDLATAYNAADMFLLPSLEDNQPNTMMESMACGTPVVGFSVGALPDIVTDGETGFLASPGDPASLGDAIVRSVRMGSGRARMSERARQCIAREFTIDKQASEYIAHYERAWDRSKSARSRSEPPSLTCSFNSSSKDFRNETAVLRPLGQLLKAETPGTPKFSPGWSFGRWKEKRRVDYYLKAWLNSLPKVRRYYLTDDHGIYSHRIFSLRNGFRNPEGPYPDMNLPWPFVWSTFPEVDLQSITSIKPATRLEIVLQTPIDGLKVELQTEGRTLWSETLRGNMCNPSHSRSKYSIGLPALSKGSILKFKFTCPTERQPDNNLAIAFSRITIGPR